MCSAVLAVDVVERHHQMPTAAVQDVACGFKMNYEKSICEFKKV